ncbi:MAG: hypothetical protein AAGB93_13440 [Planctomycetota bacterium]
MGATRRRVRLLVVACTLLGCFVAAEGLLRAGVPRSERHAAEAGRRAWERAEERVAVFGDSFLASPLGAMLVDDLSRDGVAVTNLAEQGTGPVVYHARLRHRTLDPAPDLVLVGYYVGNDLTDTRDRDPVEQAEGGPRGPVFPRRPWFDLYVDDYVRQKTRRGHAWTFDWAAYEEQGLPVDLIELGRSGRMNPWLLDLASKRPKHLLDNVLVEGEENEAAWERVAAEFRAMKALCDGRGIPMAVVVFPRSIQIARWRFAFFGRLGFELDDRTLESTRPQDLMKALCAAQGIPVLDVLPHLRANADEDLYIENDDHLNAVGNRLVADVLEPFLVEQLSASR